MADFEAIDGIIKCPNCGTHNRIGIYDSSLRPICGRCHSSLEKAIEIYKEELASSSQNQFSIERKSNKYNKYIIIIGLFLSIIFLSLLIFIMNQPNQESLPKQLKIEKGDQTPYNKTITNLKLPNGTIIKKSGLLGHGKLTVENGLSFDAAAKLINKKNNLCKAFFYISSNSQYTLKKVDDGDYRLIFGIGEDWDRNAKFFRRKQAFSEFEKVIEFKTMKENNKFYYTEIRVTLHPVIHGNIDTYNISPEEFLKY